MKEFLIKLALDILGDKETREKIGIVILSIVVGVVLLLFAPVAVLMTMGGLPCSENTSQALKISSVRTGCEGERQTALVS